MLSANICQISTAYWLLFRGFRDGYIRIRKSICELFSSNRFSINRFNSLTRNSGSGTIFARFVERSIRWGCFQRERVIYGNPSELFWLAPLFELAFHPHPYPCSSINLTLFHHSVNSFSRHSARRKIYLWKLNLSCDASFFLYFHFDLFHANERNHFEPKNIFGL